jgi:hypothetical protein
MSLVLVVVVKNIKSVVKSNYKVGNGVRNGVKSTLDPC